ncbi:hypothetical protein C8F04DRAFT_1267177 [Mycena alexandri]|uniref:Uncharacterized protein n=1 Tax=Mycena alexandri TaxID=1745969 RepID=A0AAD6SKG9_9AGAR|nr:hypothetical protein C8F04DRAFT_1267177 [Mycena alexandri]
MNAPSETELPVDDSEFNSYGGGIFPGSHHFTVAGGTFTNVTKNYVGAPDVPPDFRMIPMGDIDLQRQIRAHEVRVGEDSGVIFRESRGWVRRVYSAKVEGRKSDMTVAIYEGEAAEEEWRRDIAKYMTVRHPHILQVCGAASSGCIHATLFHGDLIPYKQFLDLYRHSPILTSYIRGYTTTQYLNTWSYIYNIQGISDQYTVWIRRSSGLLCAEISPPQSADIPSWYIQGEEIPNGELPSNLSTADQEVIAVRHLSLQQYHDICSTGLSLSRYKSISTSVTVTLAAVVLWPIEEQFGKYDDLVCVRDVDIINIGWNPFPMPPHVFHMTDGSTRFKAADVLGKTFELYFRDSRDWATGLSVWLSQANHIFNRLQVIDNYMDYVVIARVDFQVRILPSAGTPPTGYLFLCPPRAFRAGSLSFRWPDSPAYWSLDPLGGDGLSAEEAAALGFPSLSLITRVSRRSWDASVYAGLRRFHAAKGFDPDSQDVGRHLGYPLYELSGEMIVPYAHGEDEEEEEEDPSDEEESSGVEGFLYEDPSDIEDEKEEEEDPSDEEASSGVEGPGDGEGRSGVEHGPSPEATTANTLESTESLNLFEPSMSRTFAVISSIKWALILFLVLCRVYEALG